jgi:hypothetical protein
MMFETNTSMEDSGYDCDHCGGEIAKRTDRKVGRPDSVCFECRRCGCQWSPNGKVLHIGNEPRCHTSQQARIAIESEREGFVLSRRAVVVLSVLGFLLLLYFGGFSIMFAALRVLIVPAAVLLVAFLLVRFGREQEWW